jgi:hypothetical protein
MTLLGFIVLILLAALAVWCINAFVADVTIRRVLVLLLAVLLILYVLANTSLGGALGHRL